MTIDSLKFCNTDQNVFFSSQMELKNVMDTSVGKLIDRQRWQMNNRKPFRTLTVKGRVVMLAGKALSFENDMSHFAYVCKMRHPLNLVLENSEYLWFY